MRRARRPDATEISLAENEMREAMHPADQFEAFKKLADEGKGEEDIAARFGVTPQIVRQRLKLAVVSPKLIAAYRKEDMTLDCLMAFTVSRRSQAAGKGLGCVARLCAAGPRRIRDALTEKHVAADSKLALFVGIEAYEKAGGAVLRDLFDDDNAMAHRSGAARQTRGGEARTSAAEAVRGEGWKWVEIMPDLDWESTKAFGHAEADRSAAQRRAAAGNRQADGGRQRDHRRARRGAGGRGGLRPLVGNSAADRRTSPKAMKAGPMKRRPMPGPDRHRP